MGCNYLSPPLIMLPAHTPLNHNETLFIVYTLNIRPMRKAFFEFPWGISAPFGLKMQNNVCMKSWLCQFVCVYRLWIKSAFPTRVLRKQNTDLLVPKQDHHRKQRSGRYDWRYYITVFHVQTRPSVIEITVQLHFTWGENRTDLQCWL